MTSLTHTHTTMKLTFLQLTPFMLLRRISADIPGEKTLCERLKNT